MSRKIKIPAWFWVVALLALIWNAIGAWNYIDQVTITKQGLAALDKNIRSVIDARPTWATSSFAIAVWFGLIASILLLMRKSLAVTFFGISLLGVILSMIHDLFLSNFKPSGSDILLPIIVIVFGVIMAWFSWMARQKSWIN